MRELNRDHLLEHLKVMKGGYLNEKTFINVLYFFPADDKL